MPVDTGYWSKPETIAANLPDVADIAIAMSMTGHIHLVWTAFFMGSSLLFYSQREPIFNHVIYFPVG